MRFGRDNRGLARISKKRLTESLIPVFIARMKSKTLVVSVAVWLAAGAICFASPLMGTWKLNMAKSKLGHGMGTNSVVTYSPAFFKVKVTIDGYDAKGKKMHDEWSGNFDGKDYPVTGSANEDMRSYAKVNDNTLNFTMKKAGKVVGSGQIAVAPDGKTRTVTATGTNAKGKKVKTMAVYDKA